MERLFRNLIDNAIKYRSERVLSVRVEAERAGDRWTFSVIDNGIGIDPKFKEKVFGIFSRLHARDQYPGTGIGLASCRRIVERHGGQISVEPVAEGGSAFRFTLPAA
jgi:signal transduction histidine kinase